ncbi:MAG: ISAs1 family transposase [Rhodospirillaceae bacterium]|nr:ISAs1 family transposase [Rhodospirillaceae bacterium]
MRPDAGDGEKRTNEIGTVIPLLETLPDIAGRTVTADALLTQRALASYLLDRGADYLFTVKGDQKTLHDDIRLLLDEDIARREPDFTDQSPKPEHGRRERRSIWVSNELNDYLNFPGVGQIFAVRRETVEVKSGKRRCETAYGVTSVTPRAASPERLLALNRGHWTIENRLHYVRDFTYDEDRCRAYVRHLPRNLACLSNAAIAIVRCDGRFRYIPEANRHHAARAQEALDAIMIAPIG